LKEEEKQERKEAGKKGVREDKKLTTSNDENPT
jgi:hypothetical protein